MPRLMAPTLTAIAQLTNQLRVDGVDGGTIPFIDGSNVNNHFLILAFIYAFWFLLVRTTILDQMLVTMSPRHPNQNLSKYGTCHDFWLVTR